MKRLIVLALSAFATASAFAADVSGNVSASWSGPLLVSEGDKARFMPGHQLTIRVTGSIDINQDRKSKRHCAALIFCKRTYWTEHHWRSPAEIPVTFVLSRADDPSFMQKFTTSGGVASYTVPIDSAYFDKPFELKAYIATPESAVDPNRSFGSFTVEIDVDPAPRLAGLTTFLRARRPAASDVVDNRNFIDKFLREKSATLSSQIVRSYAEQRHPIAVKAEQPAHLLLLQFAHRIAPDDIESTQAIGQYYVKVGLPKEAEKFFVQSVRDLEAKVAQTGSTTDHIRLSHAYADLGRLFESNSAGIAPETVADADVYYAKAAESYAKVNLRDLEGTILARRARLHRGYKSRESLESAIDLYTKALGLSAKSIAADIAVTSIDGSKILVGPSYDSFAVFSQDGGRVLDFSVAGRDLIPGAWDPVLRKALFREKDSLLWIDPFSPDMKNATSTTPILGEQFQAAGGTIMASADFGRSYRLLTKGQNDIVLRVDSEEKCEVPQIPFFGPTPPNAPPVAGYSAAALSYDGTAAAIVCGTKIGVKRLGERTASSVATIDAASIDARLRVMMSVAVSSKADWVAAITRSPAAPAALPAQSFPALQDELLVWAVGSGSTNIHRIKFDILSGPLEMPEVTFTPDGKQLIVSSGRRVQIFDRVTGARIKSFEFAEEAFLDQMPRFIPMSSGGRWVSTTKLVMRAKEDGRLRILDMSSLSIIVPTPFTGPLAFLPVVPVATADNSGVNWIVPQQSVFLTHHITSGQSGSTLEASPAGLHYYRLSSSNSPILLAGGEYMLVHDPASRIVSLLSVADGKKEDVKLDPFTTVLASHRKNTWIKLETQADGFVSAFVSVEGSKVLKTTRTPPVPEAIRGAVMETIKNWHQAWVTGGRQPAPPGGPSFRLYGPDLEDIVANPSKIKFGWIRPTGFTAAVHDRPAVLTFYPAITFTRQNGQSVTLPGLPSPVPTPFVLLAQIPSMTSDGVVQLDVMKYAPPFIPSVAVGAGLVTGSSPLVPFGVQWSYRSLADEKLIPLTTKLSVPASPTFGALPMLFHSRQSGDAKRTLFLGGTPALSGPMVMWAELYNVDEARISPLACENCRLLDFGKIASVLGDIDFTLDNVPEIFRTLPSDLPRFVKTSSDLAKIMFPAGEFVLVQDVENAKTLLTLPVGIPLALDADTAVVQNFRHRLKLYNLRR